MKKRRTLQIIHGRGQQMDPTTPWYSLSLLAALSGLTRRQISYWAGLGLVKFAVSGTGNKPTNPTCFFSEEEATKLMILSDMRRRGLSLKQVQTVAGTMKRSQEWFENKHLLTDGFSVFYADTDREAVEIFKQNRPMLLIPTYTHRSRLSDSRIAGMSDAPPILSGK